jgi:hypothetical protein
VSCHLSSGVRHPPAPRNNTEYLALSNILHVYTRSTFSMSRNVILVDNGFRRSYEQEIIEVPLANCKNILGLTLEDLEKCGHFKELRTSA